MKRSDAEAYQRRIRGELRAAGIVVPRDSIIETADFGLGRFERDGLGLIVRINEAEYCSKWLTLFGGQHCPRHYHRLKKETFFVLSGDVSMDVDGREQTLRPGDSLTIHPGARHAFWSENGAVIEEVSTHDENADSYFDDPAIVRETTIEDGPV